MDTIFAEATPPGRGGVSIVRLSGPDAFALAESLAGPLPDPRRSALRTLRDGEIIDSAMVIRFAAGASFTGEDVVEFHLHGAPVIVRRLEAALQSRGARLAQPGEFSRRAFLNGRMELSSVEALADLLTAETEAQRRQAMRVVSGELSAWALDLRVKLVRAGALIEASLDFADEEVPDAVPAEVATLLAEVRDTIAAQVAGFPTAERIRTGFEVAVIGPPNAGKSSLLNRIARRDVALVSDRPGTTRDVIEVPTDLGGLAVTFLDTAGLRETDDDIERLGVARATDRAIAADLRIHLVSGQPPEPGLMQPGDLVIRSKADLGDGDVSSVTGEGIAALLEQVRAVLSERVAGAGLLRRRRQVDAMKDAIILLDRSDEAPEVLAERVRGVIQRLEEVVGRVAPDDYLDEIFSTFCIGK